eukprot:TRINITY_DN2678_c0_g1_i1.p1 TRINITY_DN2678_c0_g1~~TRINITY_DN2678_c0_g1_i1.p1  ORF type:complete len:168 (+),score=18.48 TRINITY_DN2678_c0_g1_i1:52-555(+)
MNYVLQWIAHVLNGKKCPTFLVLFGIEGTGKSSLKEFICAMMPAELSIPAAKTDDLFSQFNEHLQGKFFVCYEEASTSGPQFIKRQVLYMRKLKNSVLKDTEKVVLMHSKKLSWEGEGGIKETLELLRIYVDLPETKVDDVIQSEEHEKDIRTYTQPTKFAFKNLTS